jgi:hypothetical protein
MTVTKSHKERAVYGPWLRRGIPPRHHTRSAGVRRREDDESYDEAELERSVSRLDRLLYATIVAFGVCAVAIVLR